MGYLILVFVLYCSSCVFAKHQHWYENISDLEYTSKWSGLANHEVVMLVTSTNQYVRSRIIPSSRTLMKFFMHVFVLIEDTVDTRMQLRNCKHVDHDGFLTSFKCRREPVYLLSRSCLSDYANARGICCKVDVGFQFVRNYIHDIYAIMKYLIVCDDDIYWRGDRLLNWLSMLDSANVDNIAIVCKFHYEYFFEMLMRYFRLGNGLRTNEPPGVYNTDRCQEIVTHGWYQPMLMNKIAFNKFAKVAWSFGLTETCDSFSVSQDVALGIVAWLLEVYRINLPGIVELTAVSALQKDSTVLAIHHVKPIEQDDCEGLKSLAILKHQQDFMIGCGNTSYQSPDHDPEKSLTMYDVWNYYLKRNDSYVDLDFHDWIHDENGKLFPILTHLDGCSMTRHHKNYKILNQWKVYSLQNDCEVNPNV